MTFAERLRQMRERSGLTQEALATACKMSVGTIRNYEQGIREPYWRGLFQLADALGVDCSAFKDCIDADGKPAPQAKRGASESKKRKGKGA